MDMVLDEAGGLFDSEVYRALVRNRAKLAYNGAAAWLLSPRVGARFNAICTAAAAKGTWVRIFHPPIEGGYIDFRKVPCQIIRGKRPCVGRGTRGTATGSPRRRPGE
jgi:hypothetical protein